MSEDNTAVLPHLTVEFFVWLWFATERDGGSINLGEELGNLEVWIDSRLALQALDEDRSRAILTGDNAASSLEALAALAGGKVPKEIQLHIRREEREYTVTLRSPYLDLAGVKFPDHASGSVFALYSVEYAILKSIYFLVFLVWICWYCIAIIIEGFKRPL